MTDPDIRFDQFLSEALAPRRRAPDRPFIERVQQHIRFEELSRANRASLLERFGIELLSLVALACGLAVIGGSSQIAESARQAPQLALLATMLVFGLWVTLVARPRSSDIRGNLSRFSRLTS
ncbi:MAG: hypothetical protein ACR2KH_03180 [Sphingomicrobium sp.]